MKFFAVALLLSGAMLQAACNLGDCNSATRPACDSMESCPVTRKSCGTCPKRGLAKIAVGCVVGAAREMVPAGIMRNFSDALAVTSFMDGATDLCCDNNSSDMPIKAAKPTSSTDAIMHQVKRACLLMTSCWAANQIKTNALPHVPAGLADVITKTGVMGDMALTWATYGACNSALDAVMPADDAKVS